MNLSFSYFKCQTCASKVHCNDCGKELREDLLKNPEIESVEFDMNKKEIFIESTLDMDSLEETLEDAGLFVN